MLKKVRQSCETEEENFKEFQKVIMELPEGCSPLAL
jgi:hypothetical protein